MGKKVEFRPEFHGQWLQINGASKYFVSPCGYISSHHSNPPRLINPGAGRSKYRSFIMVKDDGSHQTSYVHRIVLTVTKGKCPDNMEGAHLDGNRQNNKFTNLEWTTRKVNHSHKDLHGTSPKGERHPGSKLTEEMVLKMREMRESGISFDEVWKFSGVSRMTAFRAITRRSWSHI